MVKVKICGITLNEDQECILHTCFTRGGFSDAAKKHIIGQMLESVLPGIINTQAFDEFETSTVTSLFRNPYNPTTTKIREKAQQRLNHWTEQVSQLNAKPSGSSSGIIPPPGPTIFNDPGNPGNIVIDKVVLTPYHLSTIYAGTMLIVDPSGEEYPTLAIKQMVEIMLGLTHSKTFSNMMMSRYVETFRNSKTHWLTRRVAKSTEGRRQTEFCREAIKLLEQSGHKGARERVEAS